MNNMDPTKKPGVDSGAPEDIYGLCCRLRDNVPPIALANFSVRYQLTILTDFLHNKHEFENMT